jgi:serine/threonine protein kinase
MIYANPLFEESSTVYLYKDDHFTESLLQLNDYTYTNCIHTSKKTNLFIAKHKRKGDLVFIRITHEFFKDDVLREIEIYKKIKDHDTVLKIIAIFLQGENIAIIHEYQDVNTNVYGKELILNESLVKSMLRDILRCMEYLYKKQIVLMSITNTTFLPLSNGSVKLIEMEYACEIPAKHNIVKLDIWALGCLINLMLGGRNQPQMKLPCNISEEAKNVILSCQNTCPHLRPNVNQLFECKWLNA